MSDTATTDHNDNVCALLIEDLNGDAKAITQALTYSKIAHGIHMLRATRLMEGIEILRDNAHSVDIVLLDLSLPDAKGVKAVVELRRLFPKTPVIVLSDQSDERVIQSALEHGADKFLVKGECSGIVIKQHIFQAIAERAAISEMA